MANTVDELVVVCALVQCGRRDIAAALLRSSCPFEDLPPSLIDKASDPETRETRVADPVKRQYNKATATLRPSTRPGHAGYRISDCYRAAGRAWRGLTSSATGVHLANAGSIL